MINREKLKRDISNLSFIHRLRVDIDNKAELSLIKYLSEERLERLESMKTHISNIVNRIEKLIKEIELDEYLKSREILFRDFSRLSAELSLRWLMQNPHFKELVDKTISRLNKRQKDKSILFRKF